MDTGIDTVRRPDARPGSRYEFRIFRRSLGRLPDRLATLARPGEVETRAERYLFGKPWPDRCLKLRDGALELKAMRGTRGRLELWEAAGRVELPAPGRSVGDVLGRGGIDDPPPGQVADAEALAAWAETRPRIRVVGVRKRRQHFTADGLLAELTSLEASGVRLESLAVEGEDPDRVDEMVVRLGLIDAENTSYPRQLALLLNRV